MSDVTVWHNPRCSKSRQTLALLQENGHEPAVIEYLKDAPSKAEILQALVKLEISAHDLMRRREKVYKELGLSKESSDKALVQAMHENPILIERPIVFANGKAAIGRPPEAVLKIL
ncbi:MAG: arsenate reductase (glutaredoxin) [Rhizobiaceae bacterium]|nr:arsenate reductase (glutaredoxin) [Rhizobiaceae bacterium]